MTIYDGEQFPDWQGDIFVSSLIFGKIIHIDMVNGAPQLMKAISSAKSVTDCAISHRCRWCALHSLRAILWQIMARQPPLVCPLPPLAYKPPFSKELSYFRDAKWLFRSEK